MREEEDDAWPGGVDDLGDEQGDEQGDELVDVVDRDDVVLRTVPRSVMRRERLLHCAVYVAVFRSDGRLLVHRRSETRDIWPGWWDIGVGGVVAAGESWVDLAALPALVAARRFLPDGLALLGPSLGLG